MCMSLYCYLVFLSLPCMPCCKPGSTEKHRVNFIQHCRRDWRARRGRTGTHRPPRRTLEFNLGMFAVKLRKHCGTRAMNRLKFREFREQSWRWFSLTRSAWVERKHIGVCIVSSVFCDNTVSQLPPSPSSSVGAAPCGTGVLESYPRNLSPPSSAVAVLQTCSSSVFLRSWKSKVETPTKRDTFSASTISKRYNDQKKLMTFLVN